MTTTNTTRTSSELPPAGTWRVDPGHAEIGFSGRHLVFTKVRGRFTGVDATVVIADDPTQSTVEATIDMASVTSGDHARDDHLRSSDLFDTQTYPTATFRSTAITLDGPRGTLTGYLMIRGVTRSVTLAIEYLGSGRDPWDNDRIVFDAFGRLNREDWGITWNMVLESGGLLVSKEIDLELHVELTRQT